MDESIKYILKNAGKDPKEIKFIEEMEVLILNSKNISYFERDLIRLLKEEFEKDRYQIEQYYSVYVSVGEEYP